MEANETNKSLLPNFLDEIFTEIREEEQHHTAAETESLPGSILSTSNFDIRNRHISSGSTARVSKNEHSNIQD